MKKWIPYPLFLPRTIPHSPTTDEQAVKHLYLPSFVCS